MTQHTVIPINWLFVVQNFELKSFDDSAAKIEIVKPILNSKYVKSHSLICSERTYDDYFKPIAIENLKKIKLQVNSQPCVLYGAGLHTTQNLSLFSEFNVVAVADKNELLWGTNIQSIPVIPVSDIGDYGEHVVISSKAFESSIYDSLTAQYPSLNVHKVYQSTHRTSAYFEGLYQDIQFKIEETKPDVIFYSPTQPGDCLPFEYWHKLKASYPHIKYVTLWWDYDEDDEGSPYLQFERDCLTWADLCIENSNGSRLKKMRAGLSPYERHTNVEKVKFLPSVFDPTLFYEDTEIKKDIDIAVFGTAAGSRGYWIEELSKRYGERFQHIGGFLHGGDILSIEDYADSLRRTRICVNTQTYSFREQCKGKVRETIASGAILVEEENTETKLFIGDSDACLFFNDLEALFSHLDRLLIDEHYFETCYQHASDFRDHNLNVDSWTKSILDSVGITKEPPNEL
ncbi:hypothetical protein [Shewanella sp. UCD-KL12]|uniref:glycosyltransferase family protein n=1 Tax=Shewanella sp. UCD-KL12 TaxID=1917163 RepID=UPI000970A83E|nr:hypothetical protein [Shewanella sp. UCD-KL12]